jgi:hypothetical protein
MLLCLTAITAVGQQVSVNYNQSFANYHTYSWGSDNANEIQNSILAQVAKQDIDNAMAEGLQKVSESQNPDLILTANGGMKQQTSYQAWGMRGIGGGMGGITPEQNVGGTMIVDLYDAKDKALVWRGISQDTVSNKATRIRRWYRKPSRKCSSNGRRVNQPLEE